MKRFLVFLAIGLLALASYLQGQSLSSQAVVEPEMDKLDTKIEDDSKSSMPVEQVAPKKSLFDQALGAATTTATAINWNNISWDQISQIPYDDK
ncbi:MAG TPA: hypothetical protein VK995_05450, partial [Oceanipulchritudo sp.]|nr:hypothetical protein [Oceanipulchritudo sp.]